MKRRLSIAAALAVGFATYAQAQPMSAEEFAAMAASSDMFEIASSELAKARSQDGEITDFADQMIDDHTSASRELATAAQSAGVAVPAEMMDRHAAALQRLEAAAADQFDSAYVDAQVTAHEEALTLMKAYAEAGEDEALRAHAAKTAPVIEQHYDHVKTLDD